MVVAVDERFLTLVAADEIFLEAVMAEAVVTLWIRDVGGATDALGLATVDKLDLFKMTGSLECILTELVFVCVRLVEA